MRKIFIIVGLILVFSSSVMAIDGQKQWFVGTAYAWYGHDIYGKQPILVGGWQNKDVEIKYLDMGIIGGNCPTYRHTRTLRAGYKLDPFIVGLFESYNRQRDDACRYQNYFSGGWYAGFQVDRPRYQITWTYAHSLKDEAWSSHAEIVEVAWKF